jgi:Asp/Glu/hydantoin racemase
MSKRIAIVHAVIAAIQPIADQFRKLWPEADCVNILDDSLSRDREKTVELTQELHQRFETLSGYARQIGADGLLFSCSSFGEAIERTACTAPFPVLKPNEAMFEAALAHGRKIGMLATFPPAVAGMEYEFRELAKTQGLSAEIRTVCVPGAMAALRKGDAATHNLLLADATPELAGCDAVLLAQFSMAGAEEAVSARVNVPVLTSPASAVRKLRAALNA